MAIKLQKPRGTMDILPEETPVWQYIESTARRVSGLYGFGEIRTPTFEDIALFKRGVGEVTDVVQKEMYTFTDREDRVFALRPEGTASIARAVIENGRCSDAMPLKLYYIINCFRYEKPQAGRSREFFQFGAEMFGAADPAADCEMIALADTVIRELGITSAVLNINSIGCPECRPLYRQALVDYFTAHEDELCDTCRERLKTNPLRILDCKSPICQKLAADAPKTIEHLCDDCGNHFDALKNSLTAAGIAYEVNPSIVRGLDYYTRTVFEFICPDIGAQSTICGGGRYDGLINQLGGPALPGIGFAMGITRLILAMEAAGVKVPGAEAPALYIAPLGEAARAAAAGICAKLRKEGIAVQTDLVGRSLKAQMKYADKIGARNTLFLGDDDLAKGTAQLRCMADSTQVEVAIENFDTSLLK